MLYFILVFSQIFAFKTVTLKCNRALKECSELCSLNTCKESIVIKHSDDSNITFETDTFDMNNFGKYNQICTKCFAICKIIEKIDSFKDLTPIKATVGESQFTLLKNPSLGFLGINNGEKDSKTTYLIVRNSESTFPKYSFLSVIFESDRSCQDNSRNCQDNSYFGFSGTIGI